VLSLLEYSKAPQVEGWLGVLGSNPRYFEESTKISNLVAMSQTYHTPTYITLTEPGSALAARRHSPRKVLHYLEGDYYENGQEFKMGLPNIAGTTDNPFGGSVDFFPLACHFLPK